MDRTRARTYNTAQERPTLFPATIQLPVSMMGTDYEDRANGRSTREADGNTNQAIGLPG